MSISAPPSHMRSQHLNAKRSQADVMDCSSIEALVIVEGLVTKRDNIVEITWDVRQEDSLTQHAPVIGKVLPRNLPVTIMRHERRLGSVAAHRADRALRNHEQSLIADRESGSQPGS